ncbi:MAG: ribosomal protein S18-alanine N-acetyltransferase [Jiangellaceae bacterium]
MHRRDVDTLLPAEQELFAGDPPWTAELFRSELAGVPHTRWYIVAEDGGDLVGYAGLLHSGDTADVQTLAVLPDRQRQGIGTVLLDALMAEARRRGARELLLDVRVDNAAARAFYARHGFEQLSVRRGYYGNGRTDGLVLRHPL